MASERALAVAADFAAANHDALQLAGSCSDAEWALVVPGEGWNVGVVFHHIGEGHAQMLRWLQSMVTGEGVPESAEDIDQANAAHAVRAAAVGQVETAVLLANNGALMEQMIRGLSDDELDRRASFGPAGGRFFSTYELASVPARHTRDHLSRVMRAVAVARV
jgi:hypothetical protein